LPKQRQFLSSSVDHDAIHARERIVFDDRILYAGVVAINHVVAVPASLI